MIGCHLVEKLWLHELQTRLEQFRSDNQGQNPTNQKHRKTEPEVQRANVFMVGGKQPALQTLGRSVGVVVVMICVNNFAHDYSLLTVR